MYCYYKNQEACRDAKNHEPTEKQNVYKAKLYNILTTDIKNAKSIDDFKTKLMEWIWKNIH